jgi:hypothetical protein
MKYVQIERKGDWIQVQERSEEDVEKELLRASDRWAASMRKELLKHKDRGVSWAMAKPDVLQKMINRQLNKLFNKSEFIIDYAETAADLTNLIFMYSDLMASKYEVEIFPVKEKD